MLADLNTMASPSTGGDLSAIPEKVDTIALNGLQPLSEVRPAAEQKAPDVEVAPPTPEFVNSKSETIQSILIDPAPSPKEVIQPSANLPVTKETVPDREAEPLPLDNQRAVSGFSSLSNWGARAEAELLAGSP